MRNTDFFHLFSLVLYFPFSCQLHHLSFFSSASILLLLNYSFSLPFFSFTPASLLFIIFSSFSTRFELLFFLFTPAYALSLSLFSRGPELFHYPITRSICRNVRNKLHYLLHYKTPNTSPEVEFTQLPFRRLDLAYYLRL